MRGKHEIIIPRMDRQVPNRNGGKMVAFELCPALAAINGNPEAELSAEEKKIGLN